MNDMFIIQQITERRAPRGKETYMTFIDLEKMYDSEIRNRPRNRMWRTLKEYNDNCIIGIEELYADNRVYIKQGLSQSIYFSKGFRQDKIGCR